MSLLTYLLNLVVGRQGSSRHLSAAVNGSNSADLGQSVLQPNVVSDSWRRQKNQTETLSSSPLVSDRSCVLPAKKLILFSIVCVACRARQHHYLQRHVQ